MLTNAAGCDSLVSVDLTFQPNQLNEIIHNGCEGDGFSVVVDSITYDETNRIGVVQLTGSNGCDSTVTVDLTFLESSSNEITHNGCEGDGFSMIVNSVVYDETNPVGQEILTNAAGCDSVVDVALNFGSVMLTNAAGCDSLVRVDLTFQPNQLNEIVHNGCEGDGFSVVVDSILYDETNRTGFVQLTGANGCDSTISVDLTFLESSSNEIVHSGCEGDGFSMIVNSVLYDETNPTGRETLINAVGCDSIIDIDLNFAVPSDTLIDVMACAGDGFSIQVGNETFNEFNPQGTVMLTNTAGCDSIVTVVIDIPGDIVADLVHVGCEGDGFSVVVDGITYDETNPRGGARLTASNGCDSIVSVFLTFSDAIVNEITHAGCEGDGFSVVVNNVTYDRFNPVGRDTLTSK